MTLKYAFSKQLAWGDHWSLEDLFPSFNGQKKIQKDATSFVGWERQCK